MYTVKLKTDNSSKYLNVTRSPNQGRILNFSLPDDMKYWLETSIQDSYDWSVVRFCQFNENGDIFGTLILSFQFNSSSDAILFKLAWS